MNQSQAHQQLADLRTVIRLGEETVGRMSEYDLIVMENGQIVDRLDVEADTQRQMDALARMNFAPRVTASQLHQ